MRIPNFSLNFIDELHDNVEQNLDKYLNGFDKEFIDNNIAAYLEGTDIPENLSEKLFMGEGSSLAERDAKNSLIVFNEIKGLTPYQARDERTWCTISHLFFRKYAIFRHPIMNTDGSAKSEAIKQHFFTRVGGQKGRGIERNNVASRLWWNGYVVDQCKENHNPQDLLNTLCKTTDIRMQIMERTTSSQAPQVALAILLALREKLLIKENNDRDTINNWLQEINLVGGSKVYALMNSSELTKLFKDLFEEVKPQ